MVCRSVGRSVMIVNPAKRLNRSKCRSGCGLRWVQGTMYEMGSTFLHVKGHFWGRKGAGPEHARTCPAVDILKATQQGAAPVKCGCRLGRTRWSAHWRNLANRAEPSLCGGDAALCQMTLTSCSHSRHSVAVPLHE